MPASSLQQFIQHPRRHWFVGGIAAVLAIAFAMPALDDIKSVHEQQRELQEKIAAVTRSVANLPAYAGKLGDTQRTFAEQRITVDAEAAQELREEVVGLIRANKCRLIKVQLGDPVAEPWSDGDDPLSPLAPDDTGDKAFRLITTMLLVSAEGSLTEIDRLIEQLQSLHGLAIPTQLTMRREGESKSLQVDIELRLFDLRPAVKS